MEIHPPEKPIHSLKDFLLQILTITVGILIALSLEAILTAVHHRSLVNEARANLVQELRANRKELDHEVLQAIPRLTGEQEDALSFADAMLARRTPKESELHWNYSIAHLASTSWATGQRTGAVALMEYNEVERLATVYDLQARFAGIQDRLVEGYVLLGPGTDPETATADELRQWKQRIVAIQAHLRAAEGLARALVKEYDKTIAMLEAR